MERELFSQAPFDKITESRRGIQALKKYLAGLLYTHISDSFPSILTKIRERKKGLRLELSESRATTEDKRAFLTRTAHRYHELASQALDGNYPFSNNGLRLRRRVCEANNVFTSKLNQSGHSVPFQSTNPSREQGTNDVGKQLKPFHESTKPYVVRNWFGVPFLPLTKEWQFFPCLQPSESGLFDYHQTLFMMAPYMDYSPEEVRLNDYLEADRQCQKGKSIRLSANSSFTVNSVFRNGFSGTVNHNAMPPSGLFANSAGLSSGLSANPAQSSGQYANPAPPSGLFGMSVDPFPRSRDNNNFPNQVTPFGLSAEAAPLSSLSAKSVPSSSLFAIPAPPPNLFQNPTPPVHRNLSARPVSRSGANTFGTFGANLSNGVSGNGNRLTTCVSAPAFQFSTPLLSQLSATASSQSPSSSVSPAGTKQDRMSSMHRLNDRA